jgi:SP family general alpha glucoside:H+ symporter-like MFS transporter
MGTDNIVVNKHTLEGLDLRDPHTIELIQRAQDGNAADRDLTIHQALKRYRKAVLWASVLSISLVMEGYDLVMVCNLNRNEPLSTSLLTSDSNSSDPSTA